MSELGQIDEIDQIEATARVSGSIAEAPPDKDEGARGATAGGIPSQELPRQEPFTVGKVVEVVAIFHDAIVETRHFSPPNQRDLRGRALILLTSAAVASGAALVLLVLAFARVRMLSLAFDVGFFALFVAGIAIFTWGMVRRFESRAPRDFTIGTAPDALFPIPAETLALPRFSLLAADGDRHLLQLLDGMKADLTIAGHPIEIDAIDDAVASKSAPGARAIPFVDGMEAKIVLGSITFILRHTDGARRESTTTPADPAVLATQAGAFALFMIALTILQAMPRQYGIGGGDHSFEYAHVSMDRWSERGCVGPICRAAPGEDDRPKAPEGRHGDKRRGTADRPVDVATANARVVPRPSGTPDRELARREAEERARRMGVLEILGSHRSERASVLGHGSAFGDEVNTAFTGLQDAGGSSGWAAGGLGLVGTGQGGGGSGGIGGISEGGGGFGEGTIGLGSVGTIGRGSGTGSGYGYSGGIGGLTGRRATDPEVRIIAPSVRGSLDKEIIRRVIHRHLNEARFCFEKELLRSPQTHDANVKVKFAIGADGSVLSVVDPVPGVETPSPLDKCVQDAVRRWEFPSAKGGGLTIVNYPFAFHATGE
jgi:hypothetical protein